MRLSRPALLVTVLTALVLAAPPVAFASEIPTAANSIRLRYATFDPLAPGSASDRVPQKLAAKASADAYLVQLHDQREPAVLDAITRRGARVYQYLPDDAYLVRMSHGTRARVAALPQVRWVGPYHPAYRLDSSLVSDVLTGSAAAPARRYSIMVVERSDATLRTLARRIAALGGTVHPDVFGARRLEATLTPRQLLAVAHLDEVLFVDPWGAPGYDMDVAREFTGANHIERVGGYTGRGVRGEVMDIGLRTSHRDFQARPPLLSTANVEAFHGTATYGQIFGTGAGSANARGMLPDAQGIFAMSSRSGNRYAHTGKLVDPAGRYRAVFQSNSWGGRVTTNYTTVSAEMDDILFDHDILIMQSQSNTGGRYSRPQAWAKNILSVGGVRHRNTLTTSDDEWGHGGSTGPATDGRIKPDLSHFFDNVRTPSVNSDTDYTDTFGGTSAATPITAGAAGLLFGMWADGVFAGQPGQNRDVFASRPHASTAKALLINSARQYPFSGTAHDLTRTHQGWGTASVSNLYELAKAGGWRLPTLVNETALLSPGGRHSYQVPAAGGTALKATMVYSDPMGSPSAAVHRVNDLTLRVTAPDGTVYWGNNGLATGPWSTPGGAPNGVDTVENVFVQSAGGGSWTVEVIADAINADGHAETPARDADYALVITMPKAG